MTRFLLLIGFLAVFAATLRAQNATPARPADPSQARPAMPVSADSLTPPQAAATASTNAAPAAPEAPVAVSIIAESSLKKALADLAQDWANTFDTDPKVPLTLTNSGTLRAKVESNGAPFDVVISADVADMKAMTDKGLLFTDGQRSLARNSLVILGRKALVKDDDLEWFDLLGSEWKKAALGNPDLVASGRVARRALQKHGLLDDDHKDLLVTAPTETLALAIAEREKADAVFLYKTDVVGIKLPGFDVYPIKTDDAPPVFYTAAVTRLSKNPIQARAFIDYCGSDAAKPVWAKYGFETN